VCEREREVAIEREGVDVCVCDRERARENTMSGAEMVPGACERARAIERDTVCVSERERAIEGRRACV